MANVSGALAPQTKAGAVKEVTTASFRADVLTASTRQPVLVDFWAPWCGPCKQLAPALEKAVANSGGKVALVKMNIDDHPQIAGQLGIQSIPAVIAFDKGQPVDGFVGALPESQIRAFIERLVGPLQNESAALLTEAEEAAASRRRRGSSGDLYGDSGRGSRRSRRRSAVWRNSMSPPGGSTKRRPSWRRRRRGAAGKEPDPAVVAARLRLHLAEQASNVGELAPLEQAIAANPTTTRRASTSRSRCRPRASGTPPPTICLKSSDATANGTTRRRASNCCSCSRRGV